jgi:hypothetical protein
MKATSAAPATAAADMPETRENLIEELAVASLVVRERHWRDRADWVSMASSYHQDSWVRLAWFDGTGSEFVAASRERWDPNLRHRLSAPTVRVQGARAVAETPTVIESRTELGGHAVDLDISIRYLTLLRRDEHKWRISRVDSICEHDRLHAVDPTVPLILDRERLARYRPTYRYLSYQMASRGLHPPMDLAGDDRPELCEPIYTRAATWLTGETPTDHSPTSRTTAN